MRFCAEPSVDELLADAPGRLLMASDGVRENTVRDLLARVNSTRLAID